MNIIIIMACISVMIFTEMSAFFVGIKIGLKIQKSKKPKSNILTNKETDLRAERIKKEVINMLTYNGMPQKSDSEEI